MVPGSHEAGGGGRQRVKQPEHGAATILHCTDRLRYSGRQLPGSFQRRIGDQHEFGRTMKSAYAGRPQQLCFGHAFARAGRQARQAEAPCQVGRHVERRIDLVVGMIENRCQHDLGDRHVGWPDLRPDQGTDAAAPRQRLAIAETAPGFAVKPHLALHGFDQAEADID